MSGLVNVAKGGWHPEKNNGRESWRSENKGVNQVAGWVGKGKDTSSLEKGLNHQSTPLSSLKDPSSFGPPPRHVATTGNSQTPQYSSAALPAPQYGIPSSSSSSQLASEAPPPVPARPFQSSTPPHVPFRADTTGMSTAPLPKPPVRQLNEGFASPLLQSSTASSPNRPIPPRPKPKPVLPPRLPPRQNSNPLSMAPSPPPTYNEAVQQSRNAAASKVLEPNQDAINRLGQEGVSIPGLNIGGGGTDIPAYTSSESATGGQEYWRDPIGQGAQSRVDELQQRFSATGINADRANGSSKLAAAAAAAKKRPLPPPRKPKPRQGPDSSGLGEEPPPIPMGSKPSTS
ncbi:MAG: hypothetical protein M1820_005122 [Bogoriella megaspora]|nr:MAG: hypothetical protein M1820_005122 [Bogoriella megaspora]